jgi:hypothetical protein
MAYPLAPRQRAPPPPSLLAQTFKPSRNAKGRKSDEQRMPLKEQLAEACNIYNRLMLANHAAVPLYYVICLVSLLSCLASVSHISSIK